MLYPWRKNITVLSDSNLRLGLGMVFHILSDDCNDNTLELVSTAFLHIPPSSSFTVILSYITEHYNITDLLLGKDQKINILDNSLFSLCKGVMKEDNLGNPVRVVGGDKTGKLESEMVKYGHKSHRT